MNSIGSLSYHVEGFTPGLSVNSWRLLQNPAFVALHQFLLSESDEALAPLEARHMRIIKPIIS